MRSGAADVLSIDLPWGHARGRTSIASRSTGKELARLADNYDALLGLVAGIADVDGRDAGAILTIADGSLRRRFEGLEVAGR